MNRTLWKIDAELAAIDEKLESLGGELSDDDAGRAIEKAFDALRGELREKIDAYVSLISDVEARAAVRQAEAKRLASRAAFDQKKADRLRSVLVDLFEKRGWQKTYETDHYRVTLATAGGAQSIHFCSDDIPDEYARLKTVREPDREKIRAELECGKDLTFARLLPRKRYLKIS